MQDDPDAEVILFRCLGSEARKADLARVTFGARLPLCTHMVPSWVNRKCEVRITSHCTHPTAVKSNANNGIAWLKKGLSRKFHDIDACLAWFDTRFTLAFRCVDLKLNVTRTTGWGNAVHWLLLGKDRKGKQEKINGYSERL